MSPRAIFFIFYLSKSASSLRCFHGDLAAGLSSSQQSTRVLSLSQTTPPHGPEITAGHIIFNEDESQLLVTVKGDDDENHRLPGYIAVWDVRQNGALSEDHKTVHVPSSGLNPRSMTVIPNQHTVFVADEHRCIEMLDMAGNIRPFPEPEFNLRWSSYSSATQRIYLTEKCGRIIEIRYEDSGPIFEWSVSSFLVWFYPQDPSVCRYTLQQIMASLTLRWPR